MKALFLQGGELAKERGLKGGGGVRLDEVVTNINK